MTRDFFPSLATLVVAFFSIRFAVLHIKEQHQNALNLQAEARKKDIQIELFKEIQERLDHCGSIAFELSNSLIFKITYLENGLNINHDEAEFANHIKTVLESITQITIFIEYREIVSPKLFRVTRSALHSSHYELLETLKDRSINLVERYKMASKAAGDVASYCHDLNACLQNHAFGDLFNNQAPIRKPIDPNEKVIIDDDKELDRLLQYFEHETRYGKMMDETNRDVIEIFTREQEKTT
ncbi:hypothetical protein QGM61_15135 [Pseudohongiella sp. SYSU M77423]|uniref:hypothetical protein n=1 Tax=Pseudohongiella sp. SYSU M77423 TaxID=3042312 RepID=UPI0024808802|nr:hypothetical protein [Pseudohongiella sp. SYSU M77423]MDH7945154.1 hypothetical protein [Pseudohongiella sp. SYSU M77423]